MVNDIEYNGVTNSVFVVPKKWYKTYKQNCFWLVMEKDNNTNMEFTLLKEAIWNVEDKLNVIIDSFAAHESEFLSLRQLTNLCLQRLVILEEREKGACKGGCLPK